MNKAKVLDAVKFSEQSMVIDSPYADQARHNALVIKQEAARMRQQICGAACQPAAFTGRYREWAAWCPDFPWRA